MPVRNCQSARSGWLDCKAKFRIEQHEDFVDWDLGRHRGGLPPRLSTTTTVLRLNGTSWLVPRIADTSCGAIQIQQTCADEESRVSIVIQLSMRVLIWADLGYLRRPEQDVSDPRLMIPVLLASWSAREKNSSVDLNSTLATRMLRSHAWHGNYWVRGRPEHVHRHPRFAIQERAKFTRQNRT